MMDLLFVEKDLVASLKDYIRAEEDRLETIRRSAAEPQSGSTEPGSLFRSHR